MLTKCVKCKFNIRQTDEFCLNCGLNEPLVQLQKYDIAIRTAATITSLFIIVMLAVFLLGKKSLNDFLMSLNDSLTSLIVLAYFISIIPVYNYFLKVQNREIEERFSEKGLTQKQILIDNRISDLNQRLMKIDSVIFQININASERFENVQQQLFSAQEIINSQLNRYKLQKKKVELVRLQNELLPYLEGVSILKDDEIENAAATTKRVKDELKEIEEKKDLSSDSLQNEIQLFLLQLNETSDSCDKLHDFLLGKQALLVLQSVQPIENADNFDHTKEISHAIETFNIQTTLTDFSESFDQLENEYRRLLADKEVTQNLLNYEN